jgi:hypothetical protein
MTTTGSANEGLRPIRVAQVIFAGAATIATLALFNAMRPAVAETASGSVHLVDQATGLPGEGGSAKDDPSDPGWNPPVDPGPSFPTNPGWSSQSDPGWNADPGWDFQPSP